MPSINIHASVPDLNVIQVTSVYKTSILYKNVPCYPVYIRHEQMNIKIIMSQIIMYVSSYDMNVNLCISVVLTSNYLSNE
jgi:hypothetical protein